MREMVMLGNGYLEVERTHAAKLKVSTDKVRAVTKLVCAGMDEDPERTGDLDGHHYRWQDYLGVAAGAMLAFKDAIGEIPPLREPKDLRDRIQDGPEVRSLAAISRELGVSAGRLRAIAVALCVRCGERPEHLGDARGNQYRWQDYVPVAETVVKAMKNRDNWTRVAA